MRYASGWVTGIERVRQHYSICSSVCSAGELAECRASVNDSRQSASANFRKRAVRVSPPISRFLADLRPQADASAVRTSLRGACYTLHGCMDAPTSQPALRLRYSHNATDDHDTIHTHNTHTHAFSGPLSRTTRVSRHQKGKPMWIFVKQETESGSGINWAICKPAHRSRQITTTAPHRSVFYRPDALPVAQPTASKH